MNESTTFKVLCFGFPNDTNNIIAYSNKDYMMLIRREMSEGVDSEFHAYMHPLLICTPLDP